MTSKFPIESKVHAAGVGAGAGGLIAPVAIYFISIIFYGGVKDADKLEHTLTLVPTIITLLIATALPPVLAYIGGFTAHHSPRPEPQPEPAPPDDLAELILKTRPIQAGVDD